MKWFLLFIVLPIVMFFVTFGALALFSVTGFDPVEVFFPSWYLSTILVICTIIIVYKIHQSKK